MWLDPSCVQLWTFVFMTTISHLYIWEMVKCLCAHIPGFVNFPSFAKNKEHLPNSKHLFEVSTWRGRTQSRCIHSHSGKIICMLIHADILNEAQLLNNHVILVSRRGCCIFMQSWSNRKKASILCICYKQKIRERAAHLWVLNERKPIIICDQIVQSSLCCLLILKRHEALFDQTIIENITLAIVSNRMLALKYILPCLLV